MDKLWIKWVHIYYVKGRDISAMDVKNASWTIRKIINTKKYLEKATLKIEDAVVEGKYSIRRMYNMLSGDFPKVSWKKLICNTQANPK